MNSIEKKVSFENNEDKIKVINIRKRYIKPAIILELDLEVRAGSPIGIDRFPTPLPWTEEDVP